MVQTRLAQFNDRPTGAGARLERHQIEYAVGVGALGDIDRRRINMDVLHKNFSKQQLQRLELNRDSIHSDQFRGLARPTRREQYHGVNIEIAPTVPARVDDSGFCSAFTAQHRFNDEVQGRRESQQAPKRNCQKKGRDRNSAPSIPNHLDIGEKAVDQSVALEHIFILRHSPIPPRLVSSCQACLIQPLDYLDFPRSSSCSR